MGLHHHDVVPIAGAVQVFRETSHVIAKDQPQIGIDDGRAQPVVLTDLGQNLMRQTDGQPWKAFGQCFSCTLFMYRIGCAVQEANGDGLNSLFLESVQALPQAVQIQSGLDTPVISDALDDRQSQVTRHEWDWRRR